MVKKSKFPENSGDKWNLAFGHQAALVFKKCRISIQWDLGIRRLEVTDLVNIWPNLGWKYSLGTAVPGLLRECNSLSSGLKAERNQMLSEIKTGPPRGLKKRDLGISEDIFSSKLEKKKSSLLSNQCYHKGLTLNKP